jgi:hypothetical protein
VAFISRSILLCESKLSAPYGAGSAACPFGPGPEPYKMIVSSQTFEVWMMNPAVVNGERDCDRDRECRGHPDRGCR